MRSVALKRSVTPRINSPIGMFAFRATFSGLSRGVSLSTCAVVVVGRTTRLIRFVFGRSEGLVFFGVGLGTCFWGFGHNDEVSRSTFSIRDEIWFRLLFMVIRKDSSWLEMFCMIACCTCVVGVGVIFLRDEWEINPTYRFRYSSWCFSWSRLYCLVLFQTRRRRDFLKTRLKLFKNVRFDSRTISKCFVRGFCKRLVLVRFFRSRH